MTPRLRGACAAVFLPAALALLLPVNGNGSDALMNAAVKNPTNTFAMTSLYPPTALTAAPSGRDVAVSWTAGANGNGYAVKGVANGTSSNCAAATVASLGTTATTSYTDTLRYLPQGSYFCYEVTTTLSGTSWTSATSPRAAAQIGFVTQTVTVTNGGVAGTLDPGDKIIFTFNQAVNTTTGPSGTNSVCTVAADPDAIVIGATATSGNCDRAETINLGVLAGGVTSDRRRYAATWAWSAGNTVLTVTIGARTAGGSNPTVTGTWTFNPVTTTTKLHSTTGAFHVCDTNTGGGNCLPTTASTF